MLSLSIIIIFEAQKPFWGPLFYILFAVGIPHHKRKESHLTHMSQPVIPMRRSQVNAIIMDASSFLKQQNFHLPPFAHRTLSEWRSCPPQDIAEIVDAALGWDITDFGCGKFSEFGLVLFTIRNGIPASVKSQLTTTAATSKTYCEKAMIVRDGQRTPMHFHWHKTEDIICRGGAPLKLKLYNALRGNEELDMKTPVVVSVDGQRRTMPAGGILTLNPGESVTLVPYLYHTFWAEGGTCFIGEVSLVNDDDCDNRFAERIGRFPEIIEDELPVRLLCKDYRKFLEIPSGKKGNL